MKLKILFLSFFFLFTLHATSVKTDKNIYEVNEKIELSFMDMMGDEHDWVALYAKGTSNEWKNVLRWNWTGGIKEGDITLNGLPLGDYEARVFFKNSYKLESSYEFNVLGENNLKVSLDKKHYLPKEEIKVTFENMLGDKKDWMAIYPKNSTTAWENVISWDWTDGKINGSYTFSALPLGEYDLHFFYKNSFNSEKHITFTVEDEEVKVLLHANKEVYAPNELIYVNFDNMQGNATDWIGVYPKDSSFDFENVVEWKSTKGVLSGELSFDGLKEGEYDIRAFFNNSLTKEAMISIAISPQPVVSILYENAEENLSNWQHISGDFAPLHANRGFESNGSLVLVTQWTNEGTLNLSEYHLDMNNSTQKVLEMDIGGVFDYLLPNKDPELVGYMSHFSIGVFVHTKEGTRRMLWDSFLNHGNVDAYRKDYGNGNIWMYFPSPVEHVRGWYEDIHTWQHFKVNIERELRILEPNNKIIKIDYFIATGGFIDNLKLSSH